MSKLNNNKVKEAKKEFRKKTKMLHIPFSTIKGRTIDQTLLKSLRKKYFLSKKLFKILEGKTFTYPGEILKLKEIHHELSPMEIYKLVIPPFYDYPEKYFNTDNAIAQVFKINGSPLLIQVWTLNNGLYRFTISSIDVEIISINFDSSNGLDPTTLKWGGFWFWEWPKIPFEIKKKVYSSITNKEVLKQIKFLSNLKTDDQPKFNNSLLPLRKFAQTMLFFYSTTGALKDDSILSDSGDLDPVYDGGEPMDPADNPSSDYCTGSPDWPFGNCCVAHDYCYENGEKARGCDECGRFLCDLDFLECMLSIAGNNPLLIEMAFIYFVGVRSAGAIRFNYCEFGIGALAAVVEGSLAIGAIAAGAIVAVSGFVGEGVAIALGGLAVIAGSMILTGKLLCGVCKTIEDRVEKCEADRIIREEKCKKRKKKCKKKKKWWKRLKCRIKYFWRCKIIHYVKKGLCWIVKVVYKIIC